VGGTLQELTDHFSFSNAINDRGDAAGWVFPDDTGLATAFRYSDGAGFVTLGTLGGATSYGYAINGNGVIVGTADTPSGLLHAFRARPGAPMEDLGTLPGPPVSGSSATAINDAGDIVGITDAGGSLTAFRYTDAEGMVDLAPRIPIAARLRGMPYSGFAINAAGQIGFHYVDANGNLRAMLLTPVKATPPPVIVHAAAEPGALWPADGRMVSVHANVAATDEYDVAPVCRITRVTNSQHPSGPDPDVKVTGLLSVSLRASRAGRGNSRTYTIDVACTNYFGNVTTTHLFVPVLKTRNGSE
jgi:probable HAF family extracellular repeat protein